MAEANLNRPEKPIYFERRFPDELETDLNKAGVVWDNAARAGRLHKGLSCISVLVALSKNFDIEAFSIADGNEDRTAISPHASSALLESIGLLSHYLQDDLVWLVDGYGKQSQLLAAFKHDTDARR